MLSSTLSIRFVVTLILVMHRTTPVVSVEIVYNVHVLISYFILL